MTELKTEFLCDVTADYDPESAIRVGATPYGNRHIMYITGGTIEGPKIKGVVVPGGGDWLVIRPDRAVILDVRAVCRTDDDQIVYTLFRGVNIMSREVREKMAKGEEVDPSEYYFRITPVFETASEKYDWLNRIVAVGVGRPTPTGVGYKIYAIL
jgi:hypothetical protein